MSHAFAPWIMVALFGAVGALARYAISGWVLKATGGFFPYGTLVVNVIGCFLLGILMQVGQGSTALPVAVRTGLTIGLLGAFTTFSTFAYETLRQLEQQDWLGAGLNVAANVLVGLAAAWGGVMLARWILGGP